MSATNHIEKALSLSLSLTPEQMAMIWEGACRDGVPTVGSVQDSAQAFIFLMTGLGSDYVISTGAWVDRAKGGMALLDGLAHQPMGEATTDHLASLRDELRALREGSKDWLTVIAATARASGKGPAPRPAQPDPEQT